MGSNIMDMEYMDLYRRPGYGPNFNGQPQHGLPQGQPQYPLWNHHLVALYQQHQQRAAMMMGQAGMHGSKQTEPKPRLAKDEVELLEREFAKNPKPNSSTKRELAEQMGVEVPRINNWFQNRRAKEKQMRKTAEFEAQQAGERSASEPKSGEDQEDQGAVSEFYGLSNHHQPLGLSTAAFGEPDGGSDDSDEAESDRQQSAFPEQPDSGDSGLLPEQQGNESPASSDSDGFVHIEYEASDPSLFHPPVMSESTPAAVHSDSFSPIQNQREFHPPAPYALDISDSHMTDSLPMQNFDGLPHHGAILHDLSTMDSFPNRDFFAGSSLPQFPSQLITEGIAMSNNCELSVHEEVVEDHAKLEDLSPCSISELSPVPVDLRFKSPPPPADIASRRNMRRPTPLGLTALRGGPHCAGPKTGIDVPRRSETASPMRRISSATGGLPGRVQKTFGNVGPRSPFVIDRNKEALFQSLQSSHSPMITSLNNAMSPVSSEGMNGQGLRENTATTTSDDDQGYTFGSLGVVSGYPLYKVESSIKTPPHTPGLHANFPEHFFSHPAEQAWGFVPHDEPLPTPSLCSHGGSELEFSMAPQMPGYVASQPVTPSFPPSIGPTYGGYFGGNVANAEYTFPDSYPPESSARSSPGGPPRSKQFQFAQNITPQDFTTEK